MTVFTWSATAADNDDADGTINCREGQAPSTINDSMRAIMAAIAKWRDDTSGKLVTAGTASALTLTTNQTFTALSDGITVTALLGTAINASATLDVDSLGATAIHGISGTAVTAGYAANQIVTFTYDASASAWVVTGGLRGEFASGTAMVFYQASAPTGWTAAAQNDKALRVVSAAGTGGSAGGTTAFSSVMAARTILQANLPAVNLTAASDGAHTHSLNIGYNVDAQISGGSGDVLIRSTNPINGYDTGYSTLSDGAHTHTVPLGGSGTAMDFAIQYCDVIIASKD